VIRRRGQAHPTEDHVAVELPLEVRLHGYPFSVIMRTPGSDRHLALGFLLSEGLVRRREDVERVVLDEAAGVADVFLVHDRSIAVADALGARRHVAMTAACGLCGRRQLESLSIDAATLPADWRVEEAIAAALPGALHEQQWAFSRTGGLHAAGVFDIRGRLLASAEDVGRHNAVDKLVGRMLDDGALPLHSSMLAVSGRASFEIVQKAWLAGVPLVAAVSAPSSLAVDLAHEAGITLLGFVRHGGFNVYTHPHRLT
jgi:FdhD protein